MKIYIRHSAKSYDNGKSYEYKHDPPLTEQGRENCRQKALELLYKYGVPTKILCSPFRRCRETAELLRDAIYNLNIKIPLGEIPIIVDTSLSEYLGNHSDKELDVTPETNKYSVIHPEKWESFLERIQNHYFNISSISSREVIWIVTHGIILKILGQMHKLPYKKNYDYLEGIEIN